MGQVFSFRTSVNGETVRTSASTGQASLDGVCCLILVTRLFPVVRRTLTLTGRGERMRASGPVEREARRVAVAATDIVSQDWRPFLKVAHQPPYRRRPWPTSSRHSTPAYGGCLRDSPRRDGEGPLRELLHQLQHSATDCMPNLRQRGARHGSRHIVARIVLVHFALKQKDEICSVDVERAVLL